MTSNELPSDEHQPPPAPRAIVAGHAMFAAGLISAVEQIAGPGHPFKAASNAASAAKGARLASAPRLSIHASRSSSPTCPVEAPLSQ